MLDFDISSTNFFLLFLLLFFTPISTWCVWHIYSWEKHEFLWRLNFKLEWKGLILLLITGNFKIGLKSLSLQFKNIFLWSVCDTTDSCQVLGIYMNILTITTTVMTNPTKCVQVAKNYTIRCNGFWTQINGNFTFYNIICAIILISHYFFIIIQKYY